MSYLHDKFDLLDPRVSAVQKAFLVMVKKERIQLDLKMPEAKKEKEEEKGK